MQLIDSNVVAVANASTATRQFLLASLQPFTMLSFTLAYAFLCTRVDGSFGDALSTGFLLAAWPIYMILERLLPKRVEWRSSKQECLVDLVYNVGGTTLWGPFLAVFLFSPFFYAPLQTHVEGLRQSLGLHFAIQPTSVAGLVASAVLLFFVAEFFGYWQHRLMHATRLGWRFHGVHHHLTSLTFLKAYRAHPLEDLPVSFMRVFGLALMGADPNVAAVVGIFAGLGANFAHLNAELPQFRWFAFFFTTPAHHALHHSLDHAESNRNFACGGILWDRVFGTFSANEPRAIGNGTGAPVPLWKQFLFPFLSWKHITRL